MEDPKRGHCSGSPVSEMTYTGSRGTLNSTISYHTRKRTPWQCTASVCVAGVHCWGISLGLADPGNVIFCLSCLFILFILLRIHCVSSHSQDSLSVVEFCYMLMCVGCFGLVVSTCQVIGWKDPSDDTFTW